MLTWPAILPSAGAAGRDFRTEIWHLPGR